MINDRWVRNDGYSTLKRGPITLAQVWRDGNVWVAFLTGTNPLDRGLMKVFPTFEDALHAVVLKTDPKKGRHL